MIDPRVFEAVALLGAAGLLFALSARVGMLLGRRMDRAIEARHAADDAGSSDEARDVAEEVGVDE